MELIKPTTEHKQKALAYRQAHFDHNEPAMQGVNRLDQAETYEAWLDHLELVERGAHEYLLPSSTYFAMIDGGIVGVVDIRHRLNDFLLTTGGHIGYGVHPQERRKGYATEILRLALKKCEALGIPKALVTCDKTNIGSMKTIIKNGGVLENEHVSDNGNVTLRFWIDVVG